MNAGFMLEALTLAEEAASEEEIPVGCVITDKNGTVIGRGKNRREQTNDASAHAEIEAIREAGQVLGDWRLDGCTLYVTLEPCPMCAGAILNSRISEVVYGTTDEIMGSCGSVIDLFWERFPGHPRVYSGIEAERSRELLCSFFAKKRGKNIV